MAANPPAFVYVVDAWNETKQRSIVVVYKDKAEAEAKLAKVTSTSDTWFGGVVRRRVL